MKSPCFSCLRKDDCKLNCCAKCDELKEYRKYLDLYDPFSYTRSFNESFGNGNKWNGKYITNMS